MPTYSYVCECGNEEEVIKPIRFYDDPENCSKCNAVMLRDFSKVRVGISSFKGHFNYSLGRYIGSAGDIRDAQNKIQDATGSRPIEIGNEKPKFKPVKQDVDMRDVVAYAEKLQTDRGETVNA